MNKRIVIVIAAVLTSFLIIVAANLWKDSKVSQQDNKITAATTAEQTKSENKIKQEITTVEKETTTQYSSTVVYSINGDEIILDVQGEPEQNTVDENQPEQLPSANEIEIG